MKIIWKTYKIHNSFYKPWNNDTKIYQKIYNPLLIWATQINLVHLKVNYKSRYFRGIIPTLIYILSYVMTKLNLINACTNSSINWVHLLARNNTKVKCLSNLSKSCIMKHVDIVVRLLRFQNQNYFLLEAFRWQSTT